MARARQGQIVPKWYSDLWAEKAIFDADMWVFVDDKGCEPVCRIRNLLLEGPGDDWRDEQVGMWDGEYFALASWEGYAHWVMARTDSRGSGTQVWTIDHEVADNLDEMQTIHGITTFQKLLDSVVNWPLLRAVTRWNELVKHDDWPASQSAIQAESRGGDTDSRMVEAAKEEELARMRQGYSFFEVTKALEGKYPEPIELDEFDRELSKNEQREVLAEKQVARQRWEAAGIGSLPHYEGEEIPAALQYVWEYMESRPRGPWKLNRGALLLRTISSAFQQGIPHHLFVISAADDQYIAMDMKCATAFDECPIVAWPSGRELAPSLGEWLLGQLPDTQDG